MAVKDIGLYELRSDLLFSGFNMGFIIECFILFGIRPVLNDALKRSNTNNLVDSGELVKKEYGISSTPGAEFILTFERTCSSSLKVNGLLIFLQSLTKSILPSCSWDLLLEKTDLPHFS